MISTAPVEIAARRSPSGIWRRGAAFPRGKAALVGVTVLGLAAAGARPVPTPRTTWSTSTSTAASGSGPRRPHLGVDRPAMPNCLTAGCDEDAVVAGRVAHDDVVRVRCVVDGQEMLNGDPNNSDTYRDDRWLQVVDADGRDAAPRQHVGRAGRPPSAARPLTDAALHDAASRSTVWAMRRAWKGFLASSIQVTYSRWWRGSAPRTGLGPPGGGEGGGEVVGDGHRPGLGIDGEGDDLIAGLACRAAGGCPCGRRRPSARPSTPPSRRTARRRRSPRTRMSGPGPRGRRPPGPAPTNAAPPRSAPTMTAPKVSTGRNPGGRRSRFLAEDDVAHGGRRPPAPGGARPPPRRSARRRRW